jgi:magnesium chelatase family protein
MHVQLSTVPITALRQGAQGEPSAQVRERVIAARALACERKKHTKPGTADVSLLSLEPAARQLLLACIERFGLSMRAFTKLLRVSRTIADLEATDPIMSHHVAEAVQYRLFDRDIEPQPVESQLS